MGVAARQFCAIVSLRQFPRAASVVHGLFFTLAFPIKQASCNPLWHSDGKKSSNRCRVALKVGKECANKTGMGLEDGTMQQDEGFGSGIGGVAEVKDVPVRAEAADDGGTGRSVNGLTQ